MKLNKKEIELLKDINDILNPSNFINAVYITPAQGLRNQADEIERTDRIKAEFNKLIRKLNGEKEEKLQPIESFSSNNEVIVPSINGSGGDTYTRA